MYFSFNELRCCVFLLLSFLLWFSCCHFFQFGLYKVHGSLSIVFLAFLHSLEKLSHLFFVGLFVHHIFYILFQQLLLGFFLLDFLLLNKQKLFFSLKVVLMNVLWLQKVYWRCLLNAFRLHLHVTLCFGYWFSINLDFNRNLWAL